MPASELTCWNKFWAKGHTERRVAGASMIHDDRINGVINIFGNITNLPDSGRSSVENLLLAMFLTPRVTLRIKNRSKFL